MTGRNTVMPSMKFAVCSTINTVPLKTETNIFLLSKWFTRFDTPTPIHNNNLSHLETIPKKKKDETFSEEDILNVISRKNNPLYGFIICDDLY